MSNLLDELQNSASTLRIVFGSKKLSCPLFLCNSPFVCEVLIHWLFHEIFTYAYVCTHVNTYSSVFLKTEVFKSLPF